MSELLRLTEWPGMHDRIKEIFQLKETGGEPLFFIIESETGEQTLSPLYQGDTYTFEAPVAVLFNYILPNFTKADFDRFAADGGTEEEYTILSIKFGEVMGMVHFHPDGCIEPSMDDLNIFNYYYCLYTSWPPLQIIGRTNHEGKVDLLSLDQIADLPTQDVITQLSNLVEKYLLLRALSGYLERNGQSDQAEQFRQKLRGFENLKHDQFIEKHKQVIGGMPNQEVVGSFIEQFCKNITVFPEYLSCVQEALSEFKCFETSITTIDPKK